MGIKKIPSSVQVYYKRMVNTYTEKYNSTLEKYELLIKEENELYVEIKNIIDVYKKEYSVILTDYDEFMNNSYSTGIFLSAAKGFFMNRKDNYTVKPALYKLYKLAKLQKELSETKHNLDIYSILCNMDLPRYRGIVMSFYNTVIKELILNGKGYVFEQPLGWVCINRCKVVAGASKLLDYPATKKNKERLLAEGKRLWNKDEADYARRIGVDYDGVDYRVYIKQEYCYEFALINCHLIKGETLVFKPVDSHKHVAGKTEADILAECHNNPEEICALNLNPRRKLYLCLKLNDLLYLNFIRNENQQSVKTRKANRQNR